MGLSPNSRIIIVGGTGNIGSSTLIAAQNQKIKVISTTRNAANINQVEFEMLTDSILDVIPNLNQSDYIVLMASHRDMGWIYENPGAARELNVGATVKLVEECSSRNTPVYFMSTDQVFDGKKGGYNESNQTNAQNLYGSMKAEVEKVILSSNKDNCVMRTGWNVTPDIYSHCAIKDAYHQLLSGNAVMASDNVFNITDVRDTGNSIIELIKMDLSTNIVHLVASPPVSRTEICDWIISESKIGDQMSYENISYSELPFKEPRPLKAWLDNNHATKNLGLKFNSPEKVVREKVNILDRNEKRKKL